MKCGSTALGYDLTAMNIYVDIEHVKNVPDVIVVKKKIEKKEFSKRIWKLKRMEVDGMMIDEKPNRKNKKKQEE